MRKWNRVFIVGPGLSHYLSQGRFPIPSKLNVAYLSQVLSEECRTYLETFHGGTQASIEDVLTQLEVNSQLNLLSRTNLKRELYRLLQQQYSLARVRSGPDCRFRFACAYLSRLLRPGDVIISMVSDMLVEHALSKLNVWSPLGNGYGEAISHYCQDLSKGVPNQDLHQIKLLKIRGSFNFLRWAGTKELGILVNSTHRSFIDSSLTDQAVAMFPNVQGGQILNPKVKDVLLPALPSYFMPFQQSVTFKELWQEAIIHVRDADIVALIGCHFSQKDALMGFLLSACQPQSLPSQIHIVDYARQIGVIKKHLCAVLGGDPEQNVLWFGSPVDSDPDGYAQLLRSLGGEVQLDKWAA